MDTHIRMRRKLNAHNRNKKMFHAFLLSCALVATTNRLAIVTGGTRGIGRGIADALAREGFDLLLTYNSDTSAAITAAHELRKTHNRKVWCFGGDLTRRDTRDALFKLVDNEWNSTHTLSVVVHNAGQYLGITSENAALLPAQSAVFGDASLLDDHGGTNLEAMHYYQQLYGDAYIDLCERGLARMHHGGSLIGISSPGCSLHYKANAGYDMPGAGKCIMEYAMRLFALRCAGRNVNCNVVIPGVTTTDAWHKLARHRGMDEKDLVSGIASRLSPMGTMTPHDIGTAIAFLCSPNGRFITGLSLPIDGGVHLKA